MARGPPQSRSGIAFCNFQMVDVAIVTVFAVTLIAVILFLSGNEAGVLVLGPWKDRNKDQANALEFIVLSIET